MSRSASRWLCFLVGGGINTAFTYAIYLLLVLVMNYQLAYLCAYLAGIAFSYWFNSMFVFKVRLSWKGFLSYPMVYVIQYGCSALLLGWFVENGIVGESLAPLLAVIVTVPLTYMVSKFVIYRSQ